MKSILVLCLFALVTLSAARYTDKYDHINVEDILNNPQLVQAYVKCLLDQGKCSPEGKELKSHLIEAIQNNCAECTETQIAEGKRVMGHFINKEPEIWKQVCDKYDPKRLFAPMYEKELRKV